MFETQKPYCPDCNDRRGTGSPWVYRHQHIGPGRRRSVGHGPCRPQGAATRPASPQPRPAKPAEALIQELYSTLTDEQKRTVVFPWNDARRRGMYNVRDRRDHRPNLYRRRSRN